MAKLLSGSRIYGNATVDTFITVGTNVAAANVVITNASRLGTVTSGTWNGSSISTTYTDAKVTTVAGSTGAVSNAMLLAALLTVDGSGSGLDADYVDGVHGSAYALTNSLTTANVTEVTNLYFTNARAQAAFTAGDGISISTGTISLASSIDYGLVDGAVTSSNDYGSV